MARRRKGILRLSKTQLGFIAGIVTLGVIIMTVFFPNIVSSIVPSSDESTTWTFAFPDIDTIQKFPTASLPLLGFFIPEGFVEVGSSIIECDFKFRVQAFNQVGQLVEQRFTGFSSPNTIFTTFDISTTGTFGSQGQFTEFGIANKIDKYEITPVIKCIKKLGDLSFESGIVINQSPITLDTFVTKPDGSVVKLAQQSKTVTTNGAGDCVLIVRTEDVFGLIPNPFTGVKQVLRNNNDCEFRGIGGQLTPVQRFTIQADAIDNILPPQLREYNTNVRFQMKGTLNMENIFASVGTTQIFILDPSDLQKTLFIKVDKRADVSPQDPSLIPQTIDVLRGVTATGKTIITTNGLNQAKINPDIAGDRQLTITALLDGFEGGIETQPKVSLRHISGSFVSGSNTVTMFSSGGDQFSNAQQTLNIPSNIADGSYQIQVKNSRTNVGTATIIVKTPAPTVIQPETCDAPMVSDGMGGCKEESTTQQCNLGQKLIDGTCVQQFCDDGTPVSATGGCIIRVDVGEQCRDTEIDNGDGTCTQPNCGIGLKWNQSTFRCETIDCTALKGTGYEYDTQFLECVKTDIVCGGGEVLNESKTGCIKSEDVVGGGITPNILKIRQELRYNLVTTDQSGGRTPLESGTIPPDDSLFASLTALQFTIRDDPDEFGVQFGEMEVDSFLLLPLTISNPMLSNVELKQKIHFYHNNIIQTDGIPIKNEPSLSPINIPQGAILDVKRGLGSQGGIGVYQLGKMQLSTSEILSAVTGATGAFNCFEEGDVCTTIGGIELKEGNTISVMYTIEGKFDLKTGDGSSFKGVIGQMKYFKNLIFTDKVLNGDQCTGKSGRPLLQCMWDTTGNNSLEGVCPTLGFQDCLNSLDDRTISVIQNQICEDASQLASYIELLDTGSGFTEEFGGTGVKTTEEILDDLKLGFGCNPDEVVDMMMEEEAFMCAIGSDPKEGITEPKNQEDCVVIDKCSEEKTGIVGGGTAFTLDDGTTVCTQQKKGNGNGGKVCESGSTFNEALQLCTFPPEMKSTSTIETINAIFEGFAKFLEGISNTNDSELTSGGGSGGSTTGAGACQNIFCLPAFFGEDDDGVLPPIIPPTLQIGGSQEATIAIAVIIIIAILITSVAIARRRRKSGLLG